MRIILLIAALAILTAAIPLVAGMIRNFVTMALGHVAGRYPQAMSPASRIASRAQFAAHTALANSLRSFVQQLSKESPTAGRIAVPLTDELEQFAMALFADGSYASRGKPSDIENRRYAYVITENGDHPFQITPPMAAVTERIVEAGSSDLEKARLIFDWFAQYIQYSSADRHRGLYRVANEVFDTGKGVCGEQAVLYITMARHAGLRARYVTVTRDASGTLVNHACALVHCRERDILVDPAYCAFGIDHKEYAVLTDVDAVAQFGAYRS